MLNKIVFLLIDILGEITQLRILLSDYLDLDEKKILATSAAHIVKSKPYLNDLIDSAEVVEHDTTSETKN